MSYHYYNRKSTQDRDKMYGRCSVCGGQFVKPHYSFAQLVEIDGELYCSDCVNKRGVAE